MKFIVLFVIILYQLWSISYCSSINTGLQKKFTIEQVTTRFTANNSPVRAYTIMKKYNRTHIAFTGNCTLLEPVGDQYVFKMEVMIWGDGGWKRNLIRFEKRDPCEQMRFTLGKQWTNIVQAVGARDECPYPKGFYTLKDYYIEAPQHLLFINGKYKLLANVFKGNKWVLLIDVDMSVKDEYLE